MTAKGGMREAFRLKSAVAAVSSVVTEDDSSFDRWVYRVWDDSRTQNSALKAVGVHQY